MSTSTRRSNEYSLMKHQRLEPLVYSFKVLISDFFTQSPSNWISNHRLVNEKFHGRKVTFKCLNSLFFHVFYGPSCYNIANEQRSSSIRVHRIDQIRTLESVGRLDHPTIDVTYLHKWPSPHYSTLFAIPINRNERMHTILISHRLRWQCIPSPIPPRCGLQRENKTFH